MAMSPAKFRLFFWHKSIGMTVLALATLRLAWKFLNPRAGAAAGSCAVGTHPGEGRCTCPALFRDDHDAPYPAGWGRRPKAWGLASSAGSRCRHFLPPDKHARPLAVRLSQLGGLDADRADRAAYARRAQASPVIDRDDTLRRMLPLALRCRRGAALPCTRPGDCRAAAHAAPPGLDHRPGAQPD